MLQNNHQNRLLGQIGAWVETDKGLAGMGKISAKDCEGICVDVWCKTLFHHIKAKKIELEQRTKKLSSQQHIQLREYFLFVEKGVLSGVCHLHPNTRLMVSHPHH